MTATTGRVSSCGSSTRSVAQCRGVMVQREEVGMSLIIPRWEWRTFGARFGAADAVLAGLTPTGVEESDELYLLSEDGDNVKVRAETHRHQGSSRGRPPRPRTVGAGPQGQLPARRRGRRRRVRGASPARPEPLPERVLVARAPRRARRAHAERSVSCPSTSGGSGTRSTIARASCPTSRSMVGTPARSPSRPRIRPR